MGLFDFLNKKPTVQASKSSDKIDIAVCLSEKELKIRELKRQATTYKKENINKAIQLLQEAIELEGEEVGVTDFIRLSKYLVMAGQADKSWRLLNDLVVKYSNNRNVFNCSIDLMHIYEAMGKQLENEKKYSSAFLNYLMAAFLQKKADNEALKGIKKLSDNLKSFKDATNNECKKMIEDEKKQYYERCNFLEEDVQYIKKNNFPAERAIRKEVLNTYGGWKTLLDNLDKISLADFSRKVKEIIEKH